MNQQTYSPIVLRAGSVAIKHIQQHGLQASDIAVIPAAAGGPKGLILQALDQWLFGKWLLSAPRSRSLIGASIGAWRMAAACMDKPATAFERLGDLYCQQSCPVNPDSGYVTEVITQLLEQLFQGHEQRILQQNAYHLHILTAIGRGLLNQPKNDFRTKLGFAAAVVANIGSRSRLANYLGRVILSDQRDPLHWLQNGFDVFSTEFVPLSSANLKEALLASGTLPLIMNPVLDIPCAPKGSYWDGGLIDYHLAFPYTRLNAYNTQHKVTELVLYPHFTNQIIPGWLDKSFIWRRADKGKCQHWLDNVIMIAPSAHFIKSLPRNKLPDRTDFAFHGTNHQIRIQEWRQAITLSAQLRDAFAAFVERPDVRLIQPF